jgi:putative FmdB family regulatory protein
MPGETVDMPIFDYNCKACGHTFDVLQKLGAGPLVDCPECGQPELKKLLSAPAFHLKGKGWRNSDDTPRKPSIRPNFAHTFDSATPHAEHAAPPAAHKESGHSHDKAHDHSHDKSHDKSHSHGHGHPHVEDSGGVGKIVREHVRSHSADKGDKSKSGGSDHGHSHGHSHGHKHDHDH